MTDEELKQIIKENKQLLDDIDKRMHRMEKKFILSSIFGFIKVLIILTPIVIGVIYLTPFLQDFIKIYEPFFKDLPTTLQNVNNANVSSDNQQLIQSFCDPQARQAMINQFCK